MEGTGERKGRDRGWQSEKRSVQRAGERKSKSRPGDGPAAKDRKKKGAERKLREKRRYEKSSYGMERCEKGPYEKGPQRIASREGGLHEKEAWQPGNLLYPLPVVMVSCQRPGEKPNIITVAWAGTVCSLPAMVSISVRKERYSYDIIKETGEFVINLVTKGLTFAADHCGVKSGRDEDKFKAAGLTPQPSRIVFAPGIGESPVNLECKVTGVVPLGSHDMFLADVVGVSVDKTYIDADGGFRLDRTGLVAYSHGRYFALGEELGRFGYSVQKKGKGRD